MSAVLGSVQLPVFVEWRGERFSVGTIGCRVLGELDDDGVLQARLEAAGPVAVGADGVPVVTRAERGGEVAVLLARGGASVLWVTDDVAAASELVLPQLAGGEELVLLGANAWRVRCAGSDGEVLCVRRPLQARGRRADALLVDEELWLESGPGLWPVVAGSPAGRVHLLVDVDDEGAGGVG